MSLRRFIAWCRGLFEIGDDTTLSDGGRSQLTPAKIQKAIESAIGKTGVKTIYSKSLVFGSLMLVHLSREATDVLRPVERTALAEIEQHLPEKLRRQGWNLRESQLKIRVVQDPALTGLSVRVIASDPDVTRHGQIKANGASQGGGQPVRLYQRNSKNSWTISPGREALVGKANTGIEIGIDDPSVSRVHASLQVQAGSDGRTQGVLVKDLDSSYGTQVAGKDVPKGGSCLARHGDSIRFAAVETRVVIGDDHTAPTKSI